MFKYPYGDSQQLNLDWILSKLKELEEREGQQITEDLEVISNALISATFSSSNAYNRSDIVFHDGKLYRANVNIPAPGESWNPAHWDEILLGDTVSNLVTYLAALRNDQVFNSSTVPGTHTSDALNNLKSDITNNRSLNPNIKFRSVGNSIMTGSVWVNESPDHMTSYENSPYAIIATSLGVQQSNVTHTMLSGSGFCSDIGNGTFYDYIVTNNMSLSGMDYLMTMLWTSDMYTTPIGKATDTSSSATIAGKVVGLVEHLRAHWPSVNLIFLGVPPANYAIAGANVFTGLYTPGYNIKQCDALMHTLAEKYHFTFIDWEQLFFAQYWQSFTDGANVHPNADKIYRLIGEYLADNVKGQRSENNHFLKVQQLISDNVSGTTAEWKNLFATPNPDIDENMCVVDLVPRYRSEVLTAVPAWRVVHGNVQIYAALTETGTTFTVTLARADKPNSNGWINLPTMVIENLIEPQAISTSASQTINTTSGRKISDYTFIHITAGGGATDIRIEGTYLLADLSKTIHIQGLSGANLENPSGLTVTKVSDTSIAFYATGNKLFNYVNVDGVRMF